MSPQTVMDTHPNGLVERIAQLEAEMAEVKALLRKQAPSPYRPSCPVSYGWLHDAERQQARPNDLSLEPEALVDVYELTADDVRQRLTELEEWYGLGSAAFYQRWRQGKADDIFEKIEWSMLYESWLEAQASQSQPEKVAA
jgi:hypothetical protein